MTIQTIIFSKDRPLQLHATLSSYALHGAGSGSVPVSIIYKASNDDFARGYALVAEQLSTLLPINWIQETSFKADLLLLLQQPQSASRRQRVWRFLTRRRAVPRTDHVLFLVDDNLFVRPFCLNEIAEALAGHPDAIGFSLRLGRNTTSCYSLQCDQPLPAFDLAAPGLRFHWPRQVGDFGYPLEVSSSVYRLADLISLLRRLPFNNPNRLEQGLAASSSLFTARFPSLLCFSESVAFCVPVNKVQSVFDNRSGADQEYSSEALNALFLDGYHVDVMALRGFVPCAAHQEIELPLVRA